MLKTLVVCLLAALLQASAGAAPADGQDVSVQVDRDGARFDVRFEFTVPATVEETWKVLTDYDHMAQILSTVDESTVVKRNGNRLEVAQKSHGNAGPLRVMSDSLRQVELFPYKEIRSHFLKGDLKSSEFITRIIPEGPITRVSGNGMVVLGALGSLTVGADLIEAQTRSQYRELRDEIVRRQTNEPRPACIAAKNCPQTPG
jgi:hypothetical protein